ncbi:MAG TPA: hypothetical protein V6D20_06865 [Candidatus Obscuribacterales bacterium]
MKILSIPLALGISSLCLFSVTQAPASALRLRDCSGLTWEAQFSNCTVVDFHATPPDIEAFEVSLRQSLSVAIAQHRTDFAIAHAPPRRAGLLALKYEVDRPSIGPSTSVQVSQVP